MVLLTSLVNSIEFDLDEKYKLYFMMRFGLLNDSYYTREEIAIILEIDIRNVLKCNIDYTISSSFYIKHIDNKKLRNVFHYTHR